MVLMTGCSQHVQRFGSVIGVREEALQKYREMHAEPWPQVNAQLKESNIRNYSIYLTQFPDGDYYLRFRSGHEKGRRQSQDQRMVEPYRSNADSAGEQETR
jgi:L-rhamnose mutarotase